MVEDREIPTGKGPGKALVIARPSERQEPVRHLRSTVVHLSFASPPSRILSYVWRVANRQSQKD